MKITSFYVFTAFLAQILISSFPVNAAAETLSGAQKLKQIVAQAKASVLVSGLSNAEAYRQLVDATATEKITATDVISFISQYGSEDERSVFNDALKSGALEDPASLSTILFQVGNTKSKTGAHFRVSCGVGLGVGLPLALAGVVLIIASVRHINQKTTAEHDYNQKQNETTRAFLENKGQLELQINQYGSLAGVAQTQADELARKIGSGYYSATEVATFQSQLNQLNLDIKNYQTQMGNASVNITVAQTTYDQAMRRYSEAESKEMKSLNRNITLEMSSGVVGAIAGIPLTIAGATNCR